jgi:hypothetical protein
LASGRIGTTATSAETAAADGRAPPPAVGLVLWLGVLLLPEGFVVLMLAEAEGLALEFGVEVVVPPPNRLEK